MVTGSVTLVTLGRIIGALGAPNYLLYSSVPSKWEHPSQASLPHRAEQPGARWPRKPRTWLHDVSRRNVSQKGGGVTND
jgi:hypothetical protein